LVSPTADNGAHLVFGPKLAEGKTKIIFAHLKDPALVYMVHKDAITAGDGARRNEIEGKGALSCRTTSNVFRALTRAGIRTHYVDTPADAVMLVRACEMIPLEVVMRRIATGSYLKRHPEVAEGVRFEPIPVEFFIKDDARHDPIIAAEDIPGEGIATAAEVQEMIALGRQTFETLEGRWAGHKVALVDMKIEFGRDVDGSLMVADVIDNDSWRLWPEGQRERMLDKQIYREMKLVDNGGLTLLKEKYAQVADMTEQF
jgi:phosphoribosylaminoimidazole-succinocarboxamide synthase